MLIVNLFTTDPCFNLAVDEYLLNNRKEEFLVVGVNDRSVIIGKHQVAHREADTQFITENNIPVIRRISGGGTVFHDNGNINFSFILNSTHGMQVDFRKYTLPLINFLSTLGVKADFEEKNDLKVNGLKVSGNAEHISGERVLHHGTLLFDSQLNVLKNALRNDTSKYSTRAVKSNPSSVMNLREILAGMTLEEFRLRLLGYFLDQHDGSSVINLTEQEEKEVHSLAESKYSSWQWNYAYGPEYRFASSFEVNGHLHNLNMFVKDGIIWECDIAGSADMSFAGKKLVGCRHMPGDILEVLRNGHVSVSGSKVFKFF